MPDLFSLNGAAILVGQAHEYPAGMLPSPEGSPSEIHAGIQTMVRRRRLARQVAKNGSQPANAGLREMAVVGVKRLPGGGLDRAERCAQEILRPIKANIGP
jgi:hypothetical protein